MFLGDVEDPETASDFPTRLNSCYASGTPTAISNAHQEWYCLSARHTQCLVYNDVTLAQNTRLIDDVPDNFVSYDTERFDRRPQLYMNMMSRWELLLIVVVAIAVALGALWLWWG